MRFTVVLQWDPEAELFGVTVPVLPGCFSVGATVPEAMERAREAIEGHVATLIDLGEEVPAEQEPVIVTSVEARIPHPRARSRLTPSRPPRSISILASALDARGRCPDGLRAECQS